MRKKSVSDWWLGMRLKARGYVPFTHWWLVGRRLGGGIQTILDLGCGRGNPMRFFNRRGRYYTVGIEGFAPDAEMCRRERTHDEVFTQDITKLKFKDNAVDAILCLSVLEHLSRRDGLRLIGNMARAARKRVIIITTIDKGVYVYKGNDGNRMAEHKYVWTLGELREFQKYGFKIYGIGLKSWGGRMGVSRHVPQPFNWVITTGLQCLIGWVFYLKPEWSSSVMLVRSAG